MHFATPLGKAVTQDAGKICTEQRQEPFCVGSMRANAHYFGHMQMPSSRISSLTPLQLGHHNYSPTPLCMMEPMPRLLLLYTRGVGTG